MITIVTGPIVGLNSTFFIDKTIEFASRLGIKIVSFNIFDEIIDNERIPITKEYDGIQYIADLLDGYEYQFKTLREKAYCSIARKIDALPKNTHVLIRTPACINWRGVSYILKDYRILADVIKPDRIVTLIDAEWKIQKRIEDKQFKRILELIARQKSLDIEKILQWLGVEVSISEDWTEWLKELTKKPVQHLILGISVPLRDKRKKYSLDLDNMVKIASSKKLTSFYASYSMTVATSPVRRQINSLIWKLREYGVVIDPASIEIGKNINPLFESVVFAYTVCRDLRWDVQKVDIITAFHPYANRPPLSTGMMDELGHARAYRKERYFVLPSGGGSPFTKDNYVPGEHIFKSGIQLFKYLENKRKVKLKPHFKKITNSFAKWQKRNLLA